MILSHLTDNALRVQLKHYAHLQEWPASKGPIADFVEQIRREIDRRLRNEKKPNNE